MRKHYSTQGDDHCLTAWSLLDVERLRINISRNVARKISISLQPRRSGPGKGGVYVKTIAVFVVVKLRHVDRAL